MPRRAIRTKGRNAPAVEPQGRRATGMALRQQTPDKEEMSLVEQSDREGQRPTHHTGHHSFDLT